MVRVKSGLLLLLAAVLPPACGGETEGVPNECLDCNPGGGPGGGPGGDGLPARGGAGGSGGAGDAGTSGAGGEGADCPADYQAADDTACRSDGQDCKYYECDSEVADLTCVDGIWDLSEHLDAGCEPDVSECPLDLMAAVDSNCNGPPFGEALRCVDWSSDFCEFGLVIECYAGVWTLPNGGVAEDGCLYECPRGLEDGERPVDMPCSGEGRRCDACDVSADSVILVCEDGVWSEPASGSESCPIGAGGSGGAGGAPG